MQFRPSRCSNCPHQESLKKCTQSVRRLSQSELFSACLFCRLICIVSSLETAATHDSCTKFSLDVISASLQHLVRTTVCSLTIHRCHTTHSLFCAVVAHMASVWVCSAWCVFGVFSCLNPIIGMCGLCRHVWLQAPYCLLSCGRCCLTSLLSRRSLLCSVPFLLCFFASLQRTSTIHDGL